MKKISLIFLSAILCSFCALNLTSCSDDGIVDYDQNPYLKYRLDVGEDFIKFYDVTITYKTADGKEIRTEKLNTNSWVERMDNKTDLDPVFYYIINATAKSEYTISDAVPTYNLTYSYGVLWYTKKTGAKEYKQGGGGRITHANMQEYINSHPTIEICNITTKPGSTE